MFGIYPFQIIFRITKDIITKVCYVIIISAQLLFKLLKHEEAI